jgi:hypothetical protein
MLIVRYGKWSLFKHKGQWLVVTPVSQVSIQFETWNKAMEFALAYVENRSHF